MDGTTVGINLSPVNRDFFYNPAVFSNKTIKKNDFVSELLV
jgi:hypothetical protein